MRYEKIIIVVFCFLTLMSTALGEDLVLINSQNWQDIYLGQIYAMHNGLSSHFLLDAKQATKMLEIITPQQYERVILFDSRGNPVIKNYDKLLESNGLIVDRRLFVDTVRLQEDIAKSLDIKDYILIDDTYGYSAISVAPYAFVEKAMPLFVNVETIPQVRSLINDGNDVSYFGVIDRGVLSEFPQAYELFSGQDRFERNMELVKYLQESHPQRQVIITNGEFLEQQIVSSGYPVLFIGKQKTPDDVLSYLKDSDFKTAVLVGNSLVLNAKSIKESTGLSIFVKFAQGRNSQQEALDLKYLPVFVPSLDIYSVNYNSLTKQLEVTYTNTGEFYTYFISTILLQNDEGVYQTLGDEDSVFIDSQAFKTILYDFADVNNDSIANMTLLFGESSTALEFSVNKIMNINTVEVNDKSSIEINALRYDTKKGVFYVEIENTGEEDGYFSLELIDLIVNGRPVVVGSDTIFKISAGSIVEAELAVNLAEDDVTDNERVVVKAYYGQREFALVKTQQKELLVEVVSGIDTYIIVLAGVLVAVIIIIFILGGKTEYECMHCGRQKRRRRKPSLCECGNEVFRKAKKK